MACGRNQSPVLGAKQQPSLCGAAPPAGSALPKHFLQNVYQTDLKYVPLCGETVLWSVTQVLPVRYLQPRYLPLTVYKDPKRAKVNVEINDSTEQEQTTHTHTHQPAEVHRSKRVCQDQSLLNQRDRLVETRRLSSGFLSVCLFFKLCKHAHAERLSDLRVSTDAHFRSFISKVNTFELLRVQNHGSSDCLKFK